MSEQNKVKVAMITGYLGAGKTTLLNHILSNTEGIRAAVIVNDIGEVNIDAEFIAKNGAVTEVEDSLIPMTNGCICCSLSEDLENQLRDLANSGDYDYIIIEASGICEPMPIAFTIQQFCEDALEDDAPMALDNVIAVVDCARMFDEFNGGQDLVEEEEPEDDIVQLLIEQIEFCSTLILNKVDQVEPEQLAELKAVVAGLQKKARVIEAVRGQVDLQEVLNTGRFDFEEVMGSSGWMAAMEDDVVTGEAKEEEHEHRHHDDECDDPDCCCHHDHEECDDPDCDCHEHGHHHHHHHDGHCCCGHDHEDGHDHVAEYGITTFVYERRQPFTLESLNAACEEWPSSIIRCKGMVWVEENPDMCLVFEQAGKRFYLSESGLWLAAASEEERQQVIAEDPSVLDNWIDGIGDRRTKLVFIGKNMDEAAVTALFDSKLV